MPGSRGGGDLLRVIEDGSPDEMRRAIGQWLRQSAARVNSLLPSPPPSRLSPFTPWPSHGKEPRRYLPALAATDLFVVDRYERRYERRGST